MVVVKIMSEGIFFPICSVPASPHFDEDDYLSDCLLISPAIPVVLLLGTFPLATESKCVLA